MPDNVADFAVFIGVLAAVLTALTAVGALVIQVIIHWSHLSGFFGEKTEMSRGRRWSYGTILVLAGMISAALLCAYCSPGVEDDANLEVDAAAEPATPVRDDGPEVDAAAGPATPVRDGGPEVDAAAGPATPARDAGPELGSLLLTRLEHSEDTVGGLLGEGKSRTRAWLRATGDVPFVVTGITITHRPGFAESVQSGAIMPDAKYSYGFEYDSEVTRMLDPPLRVDPGDRPVMFELFLTPMNFFPTVGGAVSVVLSYHADNGQASAGTLVLRNEAERP